MNAKLEAVLNKDSAIPISKFGNINSKFAANISLKDFNSIKNFGGYESGNKVNKPEVLFQRIEN